VEGSGRSPGKHRLCGELPALGDGDVRL
jgi:hypothetical protein